MSVQIEDGDKLRSAGGERQLLACVLKSQEAWLQVADTINADDFGFQVNRALWQVIDSMHNKGLVPSVVDVYEKLPPDIQKQIDALGGWSYIESLRELPVAIKNVEHYAKDLKGLTVLRRGRQVGDDIARLAEDGGSPEEFIGKVEAMVADIPGDLSDGVTLLGSIVEEMVNTRAANPTELPGLSTGFHHLDEAIQGLQPGRMYVVGARKKTGKSVVILNMVNHLAVEERIPVLYISTEQSQQDEVSRLVTLVAKVPEHFFGNGHFAQIDRYRDRMVEATAAIKDAPIYFEHDPLFTFDKLRRLTRKYRRLHGIQALFFDYIKIPAESMGSKDKWAEVGALAYGLKALASQEQIPVITAVQINRDGAENFKYTGEIDSDSFAGSDMIAQAMSVGMVFRRMSKKEVEEHGTTIGFSEMSNMRILKLTDNRHGRDAYKGLFRIANDFVKLDELKDLNPINRIPE